MGPCIYSIWPKEHGVKYFVYTSTPSVVFGKDDIIWGDEEAWLS
jgi:nucleoside-diphosphate-sugar epimerase